MMLTMAASGPLNTEFGEFVISYFTDYCEEALVLYKGSLEGGEQVITRIHDQCLTSEVFFAADCDCSSQMRHALKLIQQEGRGIVIYLRQQGRGNGIAPYIATLELKSRGVPQNEAFARLGFASDRRSYGIAAKILKFFGVKSVRLLSDNKMKINALASQGIETERLERPVNDIPINRLQTYMDYLQAGQNLPPENRKTGETRLLIVADLCVDYISPASSQANGNAIHNLPQPVIAGTAYHAALSFMNTGGIRPLVFGKTGDDSAGRLICAGLEQRGIDKFIFTVKESNTAFCVVDYADGNRTLYTGTHTNDYDLKNLRLITALNVINDGDYIFAAGHFLPRCGLAHSMELMEILCSTKAKIIFDIVPHNLYHNISFDDFNSVIKDRVFWLIGELNTFLGLMGQEPQEKPTDEILTAIAGSFKARFIDIRYGYGNISRHVLLDCRGEKPVVLKEGNTGFDECPQKERAGFGDRLTADIFSRFFQNTDLG